jgi:hypothetical protein
MFSCSDAILPFVNAIQSEFILVQVLRQRDLHRWLIEILILICDKILLKFAINFRSTYFLY